MKPSFGLFITVLLASRLRNSQKITTAVLNETGFIVLSGGTTGTLFKA